MPPTNWKIGDLCVVLKEGEPLKGTVATKNSDTVLVNVDSLGGIYFTHGPKWKSSHGYELFSLQEFEEFTAIRITLNKLASLETRFTASDVLNLKSACDRMTEFVARLL
jgi:hypothetical protein